VKFMYLMMGPLALFSHRASRTWIERCIASRQKTRVSNSGKSKEPQRKILWILKLGRPPR